MITKNGIAKKKILIQGMSMFPTLKPGEKIFLDICSKETLKVNDIVVFRRGNYFICHRVIKILKVGKRVYCATKGDNNMDIDEHLTALEDIMGKVVI